MVRPALVAVVVTTALLGCGRARYVGMPPLDGATTRDAPAEAPDGPAFDAFAGSDAWEVSDAREGADAFVTEDAAIGLDALVSPDAARAEDAAGPPTIVSLTASLNHVCATYSNGTGACRGTNDFGQLGTGATGGTESAPVAVLQPDGVPIAELAAAADTTCARYTDGGVRCWGANSSGQLGIGTTSRLEVMPPRVALSGPAVSVTCGYFHACAALLDGRVFCWGDGSSGALGNGGATSSTPVAVVGLTDAVLVVASSQGTCALRATGAVACWGQGMIGDGVSNARNTPAAVIDLGGSVTDLACDYDACCARIDDGSMRCWGGNSYGQLGDGTAVTALAPVTPIGMTSGVVTMARGQHHTCAVRDVTYCWGFNGFGQLGDGTTTDRRLPCPSWGCRGLRASWSSATTRASSRSTRRCTRSA